MPKYIRTEINGQKYSRYIVGTLMNPNRAIEITTNIEPIPDSDVLVVVYPKDNEEVKWIDALGDVHTDRLLKGHGIAVERKFIFESNEVF